MKHFIAVAASMLASTAAHAGDSYTFDIGGRTVHIEAPSDCRTTDCISVSIPGIYESGPKRGKRARDDATREQAKSDPVGRPVQPATTPRPELRPTVASDPAPAVPASAPPAIATTAQPQPQPAQEAVAMSPSSAVVANAPVSNPEQQQQTATVASPLGLWLTEAKEGKVRIEPCGSNLCGYSVNARTDANGEKVLINMKPLENSKWSGRIFDPNSGNTYDSTIALTGSDSLRVQGCAFGGMFCGGQTWTRVN